MKKIPLKTMASVMILMTQLGSIQTLFADEATAVENLSVVDDTVDSRFAAAISNRAGMTIEIIDRLREEAKSKGLIGWERNLQRPLIMRVVKLF